MNYYDRNIDDTIVCKMADFYSKIRFSDFPIDVKKKSRRVLADFLAELAVGFQEGHLTSTINAYLIEIGGKQESTILCINEKVPAMNAAFAMGVMAHSIELDDGHRWGTCHPSVSVIPAVLSVAERNCNTFQEILKGIVVGYDVMLRVATSINPSHLRRGFHTTGTCGTLGAAAACSILQNLDSSKTAYAISIGGLQSCGIQEMLHDHPEIKPIQAGKAAQAGVLSSDLAKRGVKGPRTLFEGAHGWLKAMCSYEFSKPYLINGFGETWEILNIYTKLYPTCRHCHASIDLAREAKRELHCYPEDIDSISIKTYSLGIAEVGKIIVPSSFEEAMFSLPFAVAIALQKGNVTLHDYSPETFTNKELNKLALKINIDVSEEMNRKYPEERGAHMRVVLKDGRVFEKSTPIPKGEPEDPISDQQLREKLKAMLSPYYDNEFFERLWEICVERKIDAADYGEILNLFRRFHKI